MNVLWVTRGRLYLWPKPLLASVFQPWENRAWWWSRFKEPPLRMFSFSYLLLMKSALHSMSSYFALDFYYHQASLHCSSPPSPMRSPSRTLQQLCKISSSLAQMLIRAIRTKKLPYTLHHPTGDPDHCSSSMIPRGLLPAAPSLSSSFHCPSSSSLLCIESSYRTGSSHLSV